MTPEQRVALANHCRLALETFRPEFRRVVPHLGVSLVLTVNSGYE